MRQEVPAEFAGADVIALNTDIEIRAARVVMAAAVTISRASSREATLTASPQCTASAASRQRSFYATQRDRLLAHQLDGAEDPDLAGAR